MKISLISGKQTIFPSEWTIKDDSKLICILPDKLSIFILGNNHLALFCFSPLVLKSDIIFTIDLEAEIKKNVEAFEDQINFT